MAETLLACMTHGRAGRVATLNTIPGIPLCVSESQKPLYEAEYPDADFIVHPDDVIGISPKRHWFVETAFDSGFDRVMMFDDDVVGFTSLTRMPGEDARVRDGQEIRDVIERTLDTMEAIGAFICGFSDWPDPRLFRPQNPYRLTGMISGHNFGMRKGSRLYFPKSRILTSDDLWVSALNAFEHRYCLQEMRYACSVRKTFQDVGGMAQIRSQATIVRNEEMLIEAFGDAIYRREDTKRARLRNEIQLNLKVPW